MGTDSGDWPSNLDYNQWVSLPVDGKRPSARYKHAAVVVDEKLYFVGGSRNGRYLSDVQAFDLKNLSWSAMKLSTKSDAEHVNDSTLTENFPAISRHSIVKWGKNLLLLGGHISKDASNKHARDIYKRRLSYQYIQPCAAHPTADVFINFASYKSAAALSKIALQQPTIRVVAIIAEGVPESDTKELISYARSNNKVCLFKGEDKR